jgi:hypothetical protein
MCRKNEHTERKVMSSAEMAAGYVMRMVEAETRGWGDQENALSRLEARYGLPFWTLNHIRTGRAKTVEAGLFARIRARISIYARGRSRNSSTKSQSRRR